MESGEVVFQLKSVDVRSVTEQAIESTRGFAGSYDVEIVFDNTSPTANVWADADRLTQVLANLLSNAIKYSPPGREVVVAIRDMGDALRLSVRDWGPGIPDSFRPHIFQKFAQADASDVRQRGGSGLGLSIVRHIVVRLGGIVGFEDAPGGGTIFYVDLPRFTVARPSPVFIGERLAVV